MRNAVLTAVFTVACFVVPIYGQEESPKASSQQNNAQKNPSATPSPVDHSTSKNESNEASNETKGYFSRLFSPENLPNIGLFIAGVTGIIVAIRTLKSINKQAELMEGQLKEMQGTGAQVGEQIEVMRAQLEEMRASTNALINKDRGRVKIGVRTPDFYKQENFYVAFMLSSSGETKVFVDDFRVMFIKTENAEIEPNYAECTQIASGGGTIPETASASHQVIGLRPDGVLTYDDRDRMRQGKLFLHFYGFVRFRDIFERKRRRNIHVRWAGRPDYEITEWGWQPVGVAGENGEAEEKPEKAN